MIDLFRLLKAHHEFCDPHDCLSEMIYQVLEADDVDKDMLNEEELYHIQAAAGQPEHKMPEQDKDR